MKKLLLLVMFISIFALQSCYKTTAQRFYSTEPNTQDSIRIAEKQLHSRIEQIKTQDSLINRQIDICNKKIHADEHTQKGDLCVCTKPTK